MSRTCPKSSPGRALLALLWAVWLCLSPARGQESTVVEGPGGFIERIPLPNGITVLLQSVPDLPSVAVALAVPVGSAFDPVARPGTCRLLAQLLSRSPASYPQGSLLLDLEEMGARSGYRVLPRWTVFHEVVPRQHLSWLLAVDQDRLKPARWSAEEIERQQVLIAEDWRSEGATLSGAQHRLLLAHLQGVGLDREPVAIPATELQQFALQYWSPPVAASEGGPVLCIVGGFSSKAVRAELARWGGSGNAAGAPTAPSVRRDLDTAEQPGGRELAWLFPLPAKPEDMAVLALCDATLRDVPGLTTAMDFLDNTYSVRQAADPPASEEALQARLKGTALALMDPERLKVAQSIAMRRFYRHFDDIGQRALQLALDQGTSGLERLTRYPEMLRQVTPATIANQAPRLLDGKTAAKVRPVAGAFTPPAPTPRAAQSLLGSPALPKPAAALAPDFRGKAEPPPGFTRVELDRGITIMVQTVPDLPTVTVRGYFAGGSNLDSVALAGRVQLVARALEERVKSHPRWADSALELRFSPQVQYLGLEGWTPRDALHDWLAVLVEVLSPQPLSEGLVELSRSRLASQLRQDCSNAETQAYQNWLSLLFSPDHPLGRSSQLCLEVTQKLTQQQVNDQLATLCRPNRLTLAFSGDITAPEVAQWLNPLISRLPPPDSQGVIAPPSPPREVAASPPLMRIHGAVVQPLVLTGTLAPSRKDPDFYAFSLLNQILGGESVTSRLNVRLRHKAPLATVVQSRFLSGQGPMPFLISLRVRPGHVDEALAAVQEEVERLRNQPPTEGEMLRAVHSLEGQLQVSQSNSPGRANLLRNLELFHLSDSYTAGFAGLFRNITAKDIQDVARRRLPASSFCTVILEP